MQGESKFFKAISSQGEEQNRNLPFVLVLEFQARRFPKCCLKRAGLLFSTGLHAVIFSCLKKTSKLLTPSDVRTCRAAKEMEAKFNLHLFLRLQGRSNFQAHWVYAPITNYQEYHREQRQGTLIFLKLVETTISLALHLFILRTALACGLLWIPMGCYWGHECEWEVGIWQQLWKKVYGKLPIEVWLAQSGYSWRVRKISWSVFHG